MSSGKSGTKSDLEASDPYISLLLKKPSNYDVQLTITTMDEAVAKGLEPGAPSPKARLAAVKALSSKGIATAIRMNPMYPQAIYDQTGEPWDSFAAAFKSAGAATLIVGGLRLMSKSQEYGPVASLELVSQALARDGRFAGLGVGSLMERKGSNFYIPADKLLKQYADAKEACDRVGMSFTICYDSNEHADCPQYKAMWCNSQDCCNGFGSLSGFRTTFKRLIQEAMS